MVASMFLRCAMLLVGLIFVAGCAADYHSYSCGCVPLDYRTPAPLPFVGYDGCPSPTAARYLQAKDEPADGKLPE